MLVSSAGFGTIAAAPAAPGCTAADFGAVVDQTAAALRDLNVDGAKRFQAKLASLRDRTDLTQEQIEVRVASLQDEKIEEFNREIELFVGEMDVLSRTPNDQVTCAKLDELKRVRDRLLTVMGQKSGYMLARADVLLDKPAAAPPAKPRKTAREAGDAKPKAPAADARKTTGTTPQRTAARAPIKPAPRKPPEVAKTAAIPALPERRPRRQRLASNWAPENRPAENILPSQQATGQNGPTASSDLPPEDEPGQYPEPLGPGEDTFSIAEIRDAGRGIFGTITAEFAGAINYAFQKFGQPNAYIDGGEGGGAFLAGLRYGNGTLHRKGEPDAQIYWQGPSAGLDFGAEGSRALFLVYNMPDAEAIYGRFTGIGGSAYVAGGVGINVLGKGRMVMIPIRSGVGLRLGANLAYLKFTDRQTWNPF